MALLPAPFALPIRDLQRPDGSVVASSSMHSDGMTLVIIGHMRVFRLVLNKLDESLALINDFHDLLLL